MKTLPKVLLVLSFANATAFGQSTILWDESVQGPFSSSSGTPTTLPAIQAGTNSVIGVTEVEPTGPSWSTHPDFFMFQVPSNLIVSSAFLSVNKPNVWTWIGSPSFVDQLGFTANPTSGQLLAQLGIIPLGAGSYGMYFENHDLQSFTSLANYRLDFFVQSVPEPGVVWLAAGGLGVWLLLRRR